MENSNLAKNFKPEVVLWPFLHMHSRNWPHTAEDILNVIHL